MSTESAQAWGFIIGSVSGVLSVAGHVAVLVIRELRRRPDTIPPVTYRPAQTQQPQQPKPPEAPKP